MKHILIATFCLLISYALLAQSSSNTHIVQQGETLYSISQKHNIDVNTLKANNPNIIVNGIRVGDIIFLKDDTSRRGTSVSGTNASVLKPMSPIEKNMPHPSKTEEAQMVITSKPNWVTQQQQQQAGGGGTIIMHNHESENSNPVYMQNDGTTTTVRTTTTTTDEDALLREMSNSAAEAYMQAIVHVVTPGETLFFIAQMYGQTVDALRDWNGLNNFLVNPGQKIVVSWIVPVGRAYENLAGITKEPDPIFMPPGMPKPTSAFHAKYLDKAFDPSYRAVNKMGIATFFDDSDVSSGGEAMYALHSTAPVKSVLEIHNPINQRSIYVKVLQKLPNTVRNKKVMVSLTKSAAKQLGLLDARTMVDCTYYVK